MSQRPGRDRLVNRRRALRILGALGMGAVGAACGRRSRSSPPDDVLLDRIYRTEPYRSKGARGVQNAGDSIFRGAGSASAQVAMAETADGCTGSVTVGVRRAASGASA